MNKRSRVLLIILIVIVSLTFISAFSTNEKDVDEDLVEFEEEIIDPNNELDPLNQELGSNVMLIEIALKTENIIDKVFGAFVGVVKKITEKII